MRQPSPREEKKSLVEAKEDKLQFPSMTKKENQNSPSVNIFR
jgi:hypothetical protein